MASDSAAKYIQGMGQRHEKDPRWTAVDDYAYPLLHPETDPMTKHLAKAIKHQSDSGLPDIAVSAFQGSFLAQQCRFQARKNVLEVGTLGGYSTIWLASSRPEIRVTTVDVNPEHTKVAKENVADAGLTDKVEFIVAPGIDALKDLVNEVKTGKREPFDFVFIDADKANGLNYVKLSLEMTVKGACIIVDNVVRRGMTADAEKAKTDPNVRGSREVIEGASQDDRLDATLIQTVGEKNYDGMLICRVK